ncbi:hypothetical protein NDU88_004514 [Pleurodeles waltl]|uniref:Uncharacterized protein n=1 Tax=Pleurodeles waltl TaxID=8319 RepID=A0AAV7VK76_PLEWA|nr:hypothetical protein NDU88_004514 [Pleurodeles waltl]
MCAFSPSRCTRTVGSRENVGGRRLGEGCGESQETTRLLYMCVEFTRNNLLINREELNSGVIHLYKFLYKFGDKLTDTHFRNPVCHRDFYMYAAQEPIDINTRKGCVHSIGTSQKEHN